MELAVREAGEVRVVDISGSLDTNTSPEALSELNALVESGASKLLVNFEHVDYVSSAGLRVMLVMAKALTAVNGELRISNLNSEVQEVFDISGFSTILSVFETEEDALASF